jgi:hypothetical protein
LIKHYKRAGEADRDLAMQIILFFKGQFEEWVQRNGRIQGGRMGSSQEGLLDGVVKTLPLVKYVQSKI